MSARTLVLLRHGRTAYNAAGRLQGQVDIPLDDVGRWQADESARALLTRETPTLIVTSDLGRAADTARVLGEAAGVRVVADERLRERGFGAWEGMLREEMLAGWPEEFAAWRKGEEPTTTGAETRRGVGVRMVEAIEEHVAGLDAGETLVVVSHGAAISIAITALLGLDPDGWKGVQGAHNAHWSVLQASGAGAVPAWRLAAHNIGPDFAPDHWAAGPDWQSAASSV